MSNLRKIIAYTETEIQETLENGVLSIFPTTHEAAFKMAIDNTAIAKFCELAADDILIRLLLFMRQESALAPNRDYPLVMEYPIFVDYDEEWLAKSKDETRKRILEDLREKRNGAQDNAKDSAMNIIFQIIRVIQQDKEFSERLRKGRIPKGDKANDFFQRLFERHKDIAMELTDETTTLYSSNEQVTERYEPVIQALEKSEDAIVNHQILRRAEPRLRSVTALADSLGKIEGGRQIAITLSSVCLECLARHNLDPYLNIQIFPGRPEIISTCRKCSGKTVFTSIALHIPSSMTHLFFEKHILTLVVAHILAKSKKIQRIYVSKLVADSSDKTLPARYELDILVITEKNRAIAIDMNPTSVRGRVQLRANEMRNLCDEFPISRLVCIDIDPVLDEYSQFGKNTVIMHAKHLANLVEFIEELI